MNLPAAVLGGIGSARAKHWEVCRYKTPPWCLRKRTQLIAVEVEAFGVDIVSSTSIGMASTPTGINTPSTHHHQGRWLRKLLRPNGRRVHIAGSPEEHRRLQRSLPTIEPDGEFDIYIHGSDEHVSRKAFALFAYEHSQDLVASNSGNSCSPWRKTFKVTRAAWKHLWRFREYPYPAR